MDGQRFDEITRQLATSTSRRAVIRALLGSTLGLLGLGRAAQVAAGACNRDGECGPCEYCFDEEPQSDGTCRSCAFGSGGLVCCDNECTIPQNCLCPGGCGSDLCCAGTCVNPNEPNNCGFCGNVCDPTEVCANGICTCPSGFSRCNQFTICVDFAADPAHCGGCRKPCAAGQTCVDGACHGEPSGEEQTPIPATPVPVPVDVPPTGPVSLPSTGTGRSEGSTGRSQLPLIGAVATFGTAAAAWLRHRLRVSAWTKDN
jgi:hypothetical protein